MAIANVPSSLKAELVRQVASNIQEGENILWCQQPDAMNMVNRNWGCWTLFTMTGVLPAFLHHPETSHALVLAKIIFASIFLVIAGLAQTWNYMKARETIYILTNRRAIVIEPDRQWDCKTLGRLEIVKRTDELSDIILAHELTFDQSHTSIPGPDRTVGFMAIKHADLVEQHLKSVFTVLIVRHDPPRTGDTPQLGEQSTLLSR